MDVFQLNDGVQNRNQNCTPVLTLGLVGESRIQPIQADLSRPGIPCCYEPITCEPMLRFSVSPPEPGSRNEPPGTQKGDFFIWLERRSENRGSWGVFLARKRPVPIGCFKRSGLQEVCVDCERLPRFQCHGMMEGVGIHTMDVISGERRNLSNRCRKCIGEETTHAEGGRCLRNSSCGRSLLASSP